MEHQLQAIVTVLSLVNPAICGVMFAQTRLMGLLVLSMSVQFALTGFRSFTV